MATRSSGITPAVAFLVPVRIIIMSSPDRHPDPVTVIHPRNPKNRRAASPRDVASAAALQRERTPNLITLS